MASFDLQSSLDSWLMQVRESEDPGFAVDTHSKFALASTTGLVRSENEDRVVLARFSPRAAPHDRFIFVGLCDGMGGGIEGGRCAEIALSSVVAALVYNRTNDLFTSFEDGLAKANALIHDTFLNAGGTTFTGLLCYGEGELRGINVGDSRAYELPNRGNTRNLAQLTTDDNLATHMGNDQGRSLNTASHTYFANQLTQCLGMGGDREMLPRIFEVENAGSRTVLLSSDGLHNIGAEAMQDILLQSDSLVEAAEKLIEASGQMGGDDNASLALIKSLSGADLEKNESGMLELHSPGISSLKYADIEHTL
jgi:serine/threonine protein phosphatase PrpC